MLVTGGPGRQQLEGVMSMRVMKIATVIGAIVLLGADPVLARAATPAEEKKKADENKPNQLEGVLAAVDTAGNKLRIISGNKDPKTGLKSETDQTFPVAADARITLAGEGKKAAMVVKLGDLKDG